MPDSAYHLAQVNIARLLAPLTDPVMADFVVHRPTLEEAVERMEHLKQQGRLPARR
ncbi:MAG TPA: hypothetical protein VES67_16955 [Vicinamibacterales bacterium]|nr:hypothetical protein [Vicinamibacterales bacterium]